MSSSASDSAAIREALDRYLWSIDTHDADEFTANFTEDAVYETPMGSATGQAQIRAAIEGWHGSGLTTGKRHMGGPARLTLDDDHAHVRSSYFIVEAASAPSIVASGDYDDVWVRREDRWLLQRRVQTIDPSFQMPGAS